MCHAVRGLYQPDLRANLLTGYIGALSTRQQSKVIGQTYVKKLWVVPALFENQIDQKRISLRRKHAAQRPKKAQRRCLDRGVCRFAIDKNKTPTKGVFSPIYVIATPFCGVLSFIYHSCTNTST